MNFGFFKIIVATPNVNAFLQIKNFLKDKYQLIPCYEINETLKTIFNDKISLIILDTKQNNFIGTQPLYSFLYEIDMAKKIPMIMMNNNKQNLSFSNYGYGQLYNLEDLDNNVETTILQNKNFFKDNEDIQNFISSLIIALESKDEYSRNHSARVAKYAEQLAKDMGKSQNFVSVVHMAGLFHDIGKIGIPDTILLKPTKLTDEEFDIIKTHPEKSENICSPIKIFSRLLPIVRGHHERFDGKGYPDNLKGFNIPEESRIIAIADAFDALTSNRAYRIAFSMEKVLSIMNDNAGTQWDSDIIKCFLDNFEEKKVINLLKQTPTINFINKENLINGTIFNKEI